MVDVAQLVRALDCGSRGRRFEPALPPKEDWRRYQKLITAFFIMETFFVYILLSKKTGKFYIGQTNNIENRLMKHNSGLNRSTKAGIPWELYCYRQCKTRTESMAFERKLKNLKSRVRLEKYISEHKGWVLISQIL
jgi:putative endonuclease